MMKRVMVMTAVVGFGVASAAGAADAPKAADGGALYAKQCASCHGKDGAGNPKMAKMLKADPAALNLVDEASLAKSDADLAKVIAEGSPTNKKMAAYGKKLKADQIAAIVAHIRSLKPAAAAPAAEPAPAAK